MTTINAVDTGHRLRAYVRLAKLSFYDYYLSVLVVWSLLALSVQFNADTIITLLLVDLGWVGVVAATVTFDDVTGFRDGSDNRNYDPGQAVLRDRGRKPLLTGEITVGQAIRFGTLAATVGAVMWTLAFAVAPFHPAWTILAAAFVIFISVQYSYGLKLSYRGGQELILLLSPGLIVLFPFGLLAGEMTGLILLESFLFGLWSLLVSVYSNMNDLEGDRAAGRRNLAIMNSPDRYRVIVALISITETIAIVAAVALGAASAWFLVFLSPVLIIRGKQMRTGLLERNPLSARKMGIQAHRLGVFILIAANLVLVS